ncbi:MAG: hypothetical protein Q9167_007298 [Letrouitia subvulpina]
MDSSPDTTRLIKSLKRRTSSILKKPTPLRTTTFLDHQLDVVETKLELRCAQLRAMSESSTFFTQNNKKKEDFEKEARRERKRLVTEKIILLSCRRSLVQDLNDTCLGEDVGISRQKLADAYIDELTIALEKSSSESEKNIKVPRWKRKKFAKEVHSYLGTKRGGRTKGHWNFCNVMGIWLPSSNTKVAQIVPWSWDYKTLDYAFVNNVVCKYGPPFGSKEVVWRWSDLDGRQLTFLNNNRPARRFLYLRHALALICAKENQWADYQQKVPPGEVWASPAKNEGYLRTSILLDLAKRVGDTLPSDLVAVGGFEDPSTSTPIADVCAREGLAEDMADYVEADDKKEETEGSKEEDSEEESEEESEENFDEVA